MTKRPDNDTQQKEAEEAKKDSALKEVREEDKKTVDTGLTFTGKSGEYFKIWVVNVFLTILTLGIYSAWAKVRKKKYFYRNTFLLDASFDYLADPKKILKGRLIVFGNLIIIVAAIYVHPPLIHLPLLLILAIPASLLFPWLVVKALKFKARNSSYRYIRFNFLGTYWEAFKVLILQMLITMVTFGIGYAYQRYRRTKFIFENGAFGNAPFKVTFRDSGGFYRVYFWQPMGVGILVALANTAVLALGSFILPHAIYPMFESFISLLASLSIIAFLRAAGANLVWSHVVLGGYPSTVFVYFRSTLSPPRMIWIYLTNAIAILFSLGLLIPWASVRTARYRLSNLFLSISGGLDSFVAGEQEKVEALGEEITDFFDFDFGL